jgi:serine/threonine protein phosphatase 1
MMLDARTKSSWLKPWLSYGGDATLKSYASQAGDDGSLDDLPESHIDFLKNNLQAFFENETHFFVHAGVDADIALENQKGPSLYWRKYRNIKPHCSGKIMVCGHSPQKTGMPLGNKHSICIDTWAHGEGWLTCLDADSGVIWQANEAGGTRNFTIDDIDRLE